MGRGVRRGKAAKGTPRKLAGARGVLGVQLVEPRAISIKWAKVIRAADIKPD